MDYETRWPYRLFLPWGGSLQINRLHHHKVKIPICPTLAFLPNNWKPIKFPSASAVSFLPLIVVKCQMLVICWACTVSLQSKQPLCLNAASESSEQDFGFLKLPTHIHTSCDSQLRAIKLVQAQPRKPCPSFSLFVCLAQAWVGLIQTAAHAESTELPPPSPPTHHPQWLYWYSGPKTHLLETCDYLKSICVTLHMDRHTTLEKNKTSFPDRNTVSVWWMWRRRRGLQGGRQVCDIYSSSSDCRPAAAGEWRPPLISSLPTTFPVPLPCGCVSQISSWLRLDLICSSCCRNVSISRIYPAVTLLATQSLGDFEFQSLHLIISVCLLNPGEDVLAVIHWLCCDWILLYKSYDVALCAQDDLVLCWIVASKAEGRSDCSGQLFCCIYWINISSMSSTGAAERAPDAPANNCSIHECFTPTDESEALMRKDMTKRRKRKCECHWTNWLDKTCLIDILVRYWHFN